MFRILKRRPQYKMSIYFTFNLLKLWAFTDRGPQWGLKINVLANIFMQKTINIISEAYKITKNPYHGIFVFSSLHIFQNFASFFKTLHTNPRIAHKMQNASHLLHSQYHKHISKANICKHTFAIPVRFVCVT